MLVKKIILFVLTLFIVGIMSVLFSITVFAADIPDLTSGTYDATAGTLSISGTFVQAKASEKSIDPKKFILTDGSRGIYQLTSAKVAPTLSATDADTATITLATKDKTALALFLNKAGTTSETGGTYKIMVLAGWNGKTSLSDIEGAALTVSNLPSLSSATYDSSTYKLKLTGSIASITGSSNDVTPKYLAITDKYSYYYQLTNSKKVDASSGSAEITLSTADITGFEGIIDKDGTTNTAGKEYRLLSQDGWNGPGSSGNASGVLVTVSGYAKPTVTATDKEVTIGAAVKAKLSKVGTLYLVASGTTVLSGSEVISTTAITTRAILEKFALSTTTTAVAQVSSKKANSDVSLATKKLTITDDETQYILFGMDRGGYVVSATDIVIVNAKTATTLKATAAKGSEDGTTKITVTGATEGNKLAIKRFTYDTSKDANAAAKLVLQYSDLPDDATVYTSGSTISGVGVTDNNWIGVYDYNETTNKVAKFKLVQMKSTTVDPITFKTSPASNVTVTSTSATTTTVTLTASNVDIELASVTVTTKTTYKTTTLKAKAISTAAKITSGALVISFDLGTTSGLAVGDSVTLTLPKGICKDINGNSNDAATITYTIPAP